MTTGVVYQEDDTLREHLASAIAHCCSWGSNCYEFGRLGAVTPLVGYMMSKDSRVHRTTALALCELSQDPFNCVTLHQSGVVPVSAQTVCTISVSVKDSRVHFTKALAQCDLIQDPFNYVIVRQSGVVLVSAQTLCTIDVSVKDSRTLEYTALTALALCELSQALSTMSPSIREESYRSVHKHFV